MSAATAKLGSALKPQMRSARAVVSSYHNARCEKAWDIVTE